MTNIEVSSSPKSNKEAVAVKVDPVARSLVKDDALMKPATVGKAPGRGTPSTRVRLTNEKPKGRPRIRKRDPRNVVFF